MCPDRVSFTFYGGAVPPGTPPSKQVGEVGHRGGGRGGAQGAHPRGAVETQRARDGDDASATGAAGVVCETRTDSRWERARRDHFHVGQSGLHPQGDGGPIPNG